MKQSALRLSEQTATCATYSIKWLVFITEMKSVYSAVRSGSLNEAVCASSVKGYRVFQEARVSFGCRTDQLISWLVFLKENYRSWNFLQPSHHLSQNLALIVPLLLVQHSTTVPWELIYHFNPFQPSDAIWHHTFHPSLTRTSFAQWLQ